MIDEGTEHVKVIDIGVVRVCRFTLLYGSRGIDAQNT